MKGKLSKILVAISFMFLVPNFCMGQKLVGVWKLAMNDNTSQNAKSRYKVFDKDGNYYNVDAFLKSAKEGISTKKGGVFCPCKVTRSGSYRILDKGLYCEIFKYYAGEPTGVEQIPISYQINGKEMVLLFQLGNSVYRETYHKVSSVGE